MSKQQYETRLLKFADQGEKTGWTYIEIPADIAQKLKPGNKKSFRVKGLLDKHKISMVALLPMGEGGFIMAVNADMRKGIGKRHGAMVKVVLEADKSSVVLNKEMMECINDDPDAIKFFKTLAPSHQHYFSKWIDSAKTDETKTKRIAQSVNALSKKMGYPQMLRALKKNK